MNKIQEQIEKTTIEIAERIVIDYANFSGRESANRAEFREKTIQNLRTSQQKLLEAVREEVERLIQEERYSGVPIAMNKLLALLTIKKK